MRPQRLLAIAMLAAVIGASFPAQARDNLAGYPVTKYQVLGPGVRYLRLSGHEQSINIIKVDPDAPYELRAVLSPKGQELTSRVCQRTHCIAAINGDFNDPTTAETSGGVVAQGEILRTGKPQYSQLSITPTGTPIAGVVRWSGRLLGQDLKPLAKIDGVNVRPRRGAKIVLYSRNIWLQRLSRQPRLYVVLKLIGRRRLLLNRPALVGYKRLLTRQPKLKAGEIVLAGYSGGGSSLRTVWRRHGRQGWLLFESDPPITESVGGRPVLLHEGKIVFDPNAPYVFNYLQARNPRTAVGWNQVGHIWLLVDDGRQPGYSRGMTYPELAKLLLKLGATEAIALDGGGSSTMVAKGKMVNRPADAIVMRNGRRMKVEGQQSGDLVIRRLERPRPLILALYPKPRTDSSASVHRQPLYRASDPVVPIPLPLLAADNPPSLRRWLEWWAAMLLLAIFITAKHSQVVKVEWQQRLSKLRQGKA